MQGTRGEKKEKNREKGKNPKADTWAGSGSCVVLVVFLDCINAFLTSAKAAREKC